MTIADQITRLTNAKAAIKTSIENKGVTVSDSALLDEYPALIDSIESGSGEGGGSGETYENPDFYELRTNGGTDYHSLFSEAYYNQIPDFSTWDTSKVTDMARMFYSCMATTLDLSSFDTSNVTDMDNMFYYCMNLTTLDLSSFDTSNVTNMNNMFYSCKNLTSIDVSNFDTSNVTTMKEMFYGCTDLTSLDLSNFNTSKVTDMYRMFYNCTNLTSLDLSSFDTSNVTNMNYMFYSCKNLTSITGELDASNLTNGFYPGSSSNPFRSCSSLETLYLKNIYTNCTMTNASKWSINLGETKVKDECLIYIINELPDLLNDKGLMITGSIVLTLPPTNTLTAEQVQVAVSKGWTVANTTY